MTILSRESATALPLFVFHLRPFLQPRWRYEREDFFFVPIAAACDTERGQAQFSARDVKRGHKDEKMNIVKCIHCGKCITEVVKGCKVARSLSTTQGGNSMDLKGMNRYQHFGLRSSWVEHFFDEGNDCWTSKELGNRQYDALKVYLKEAEIIDSGSGSNSNSKITDLGKALMELGPFHPFVWSTIWTNLAYNSTLVRWYLLCVPPKEIYDKPELISMIDDMYSESTRTNSITSLAETFVYSPIGSTLEMGIPIASGNSYRFNK